MIMTMIAANLHLVRERIVTACTAADRDPAGVELLAVSKTFPADGVREALAGGQAAFGENYVQEGVAKIEALAWPMCARNSCGTASALCRATRLAWWPSISTGCTPWIA